MMEKIELRVTFPVSSSFIYNAWLNSKEHSKMTGAEAHCSTQVEGEFLVWEGYISGKNIFLDPHKKIIQSWRTSEFENNTPDSELTLIFIETDSGCELQLSHNNIPEGQPDYKQGWIDHYFTPMKQYFNAE